MEENPAFMFRLSDVCFEKRSEGSYRSKVFTNSVLMPMILKCKVCQAGVHIVILAIGYNSAHSVCLHRLHCLDLVLILHHLDFPDQPIVLQCYRVI